MAASCRVTRSASRRARRLPMAPAWECRPNTFPIRSTCTSRPSRATRSRPSPSSVATARRAPRTRSATGNGAMQPRSQQQLEQWEVSPRSTLFVAREAGRVIGFCGVECYPRERIGLVHGPVVAPGSRGRGVSKALFEVALRNGVTSTARPSCGPRPAATTAGRRALYGEAGFTRDEVTALFQLERDAHTPASRARSTCAVSPRTICPRCSRSPSRSATTCT